MEETPAPEIPAVPPSAARADDAPLAPYAVMALAAAELILLVKLWALTGGRADLMEDLRGHMNPVTLFYFGHPLLIAASSLPVAGGALAFVARGRSTLRVKTCFLTALALFAAASFADTASLALFWVLVN